MAENSKIEWTDHTFNPWIGCTKVSAACDHCYAEAWDARGLQQRETRWGPHADRTRTSAANWRKPLAWNKAAAASGTRARVFCASLADVFDNHASILPAWRSDLFNLISQTPHLDWLLLTKRPQNIARMMPNYLHTQREWPNVWLGTTAENQTEADRRIPHLLAVPAAVRFLSMEPLFGPVDLSHWMGVHHSRDNNLSDPETHAAINKMILLAREQFRAEHGNHGISWVIVGGESGPHARPMHPDWARSLRDQCAAAGVPFLFKQWGEWLPLNQTALGGDDAYYHPAPEADPEASRRCKYDSLSIAPDGASYSTGTAHQYHRIAEGAFAGAGHMQCFKIGKARAGRLLDGVEHNGFPQIGGAA